MVFALGAAIIVSCKKKVDPAPAPSTTTSGTTTSGTTTSGTTTSGGTTGGTSTSGTTGGSTTSSATTKTTLLINKNWKMTAFSGSINGGASIDGYTPMRACDKDDIVRFSAASSTSKTGTAAFDMKTKCNASEMNYSGTWSFNAAETSLTITPDGAVSDGAFGLVDLNATTLKITKTVTDNTGTSVETLTYTAQ